MKPWKVLLGLGACAAMCVFGYARWTRARATRCERAWMQNLADHVPLGTPRAKLDATLPIMSWDGVDGGAGEAYVTGYTECGFRRAGAAHGVFRLEGGVVVSCVLNGMYSYVFCAEPQK